jgi:hypothetical protein
MARFRELLDYSLDAKKRRKELTMSRNYWKYWILLAAFAAKITCAQTQINLQNQARDVNFSAAVSTIPAQTGTVLPTTFLHGRDHRVPGKPGGSERLCLHGR